MCIIHDWQPTTAEFTVAACWHYHKVRVCIKCGQLRADLKKTCSDKWVQITRRRGGEEVH